MTPIDSFHLLKSILHAVEEIKKKKKNLRYIEANFSLHIEIITIKSKTELSKI